MNIPSGAFVSFEVMPTYDRIGVISVGDNGAFELRLRQEYKYDWNTDNVKFQYRDANGVVYESVFNSLNNLYSFSFTEYKGRPTFGVETAPLPFYGIRYI